mmetsp:Transcript_31031/g.51270  ORF Transcript_31031/g.51270 Transcript_31031/m.51270 type:complete len:305 (+) Transcript_31031:135-1049(+)|eukprot:CAMPEP_0119014806 /NCGR_PEP_ID=MMETSP1176-20130426/10398_1 /TAXON_ID=265551 /ORGANISM="Synedropsis recta cf, Strain CCMP1620" /LENGTH=304 /DNA_ID=CAMNT_0006968049 /DNA_START=135 /DNA_END=1049 /DNA_ORIENTATION=+
MVYSTTSVVFLFAICSNCASGITTIALPNFSFQTLVKDGDTTDLYDFRNHLDHATENHLSEFIEKTLTIDLGGSAGGFEGLHLESTVRRTQSQFATDPRAVIQTSFQGKALFSDVDSNTQIMNEGILHLVVAQAFVGDAYWNLMHQFVEDPVLQNVDNLDVVIDYSIVQDKGGDQHLKTEDDKKNSGAIAVLAIFSTIMCLSTMFLLLLAHRRYKSEASSCCHSLKSSDSTDGDDDDDIQAEEEDFDDEEVPKGKSTAPPRKKKRRVKPNEKMVLEVPSLDSILEEDEGEEEMSIVPLGNLILI